MLPIQLVDIEAFWMTLEIDYFHPSSQEDMDMDSEMRLLTDLVLIAHRKIQKSTSSGSGSGSGFGSGSGSVSGSRGRGRPQRAPRGRGREHSRGRSSLSSVIDPSLYSIFPYTDAFPTFIYPFIENWKNVIGDGNCGYWVVDHPGGILVIGILTEQQYFIQLQMHDRCPMPPLHLQWVHHCSDRVSSWADTYYDRIADWNARFA
ncbi:hypothetical protein M9H77_26465 [Catharanthus roseus]|uniref:Uncharacterized protein n=1 Tax=Catharanthus roseus TaxID=4058 RepID=A0ACC0A9R3_CATRO|nr:hypothetical protein M9H77_26465 [Catharanthus roseus]